MTGRNMLIPFLVAAAVGIFGSLFLYNHLRSEASAASERTVPGYDPQRVSFIAVAREPIAWGQKLDESDNSLSLLVESKPFFRESLPEGHFVNLEHLAGRVVIHNLKRGEPILASDLAPSTVRNGGIGAVVKPGMRAVRVTSKELLFDPDFVHAGDHVDVLVTLADDDDKDKVTKIVLADVVVLAAESKEDSRSGHVNSAVTLQVTPVETEKLNIARARGKLHLALRNILDTETINTDGATVTDALSSYKDKRVEPPKEKPQVKRRRRDTVMVITGSSETKHIF